MKKIVLLTMIILLCACNLLNTPSSVVEEYLNKYNSLNEDVLADLETTIINEDLSLDNRNIYKKVLIREYENIKYEIKDESIDNDKAEVRVLITVYDLNKINEEALNYMNEHLEEFSDVNHNFDNESFNRYRLNNMLVTNDTVQYEIIFKLSKVNNEWILNQLDHDSLEKLHGLYNKK